MIKLEKIIKDYGGKDNVTHALRGIDLTIEDGEFVAIVGASGSGKSTLLNIIGAMDTATSGRYLFDEKCITELSKRELDRFRKEYISFVFQDFALMDKYTVYENVEMPLIPRRITKKKEKVMEQLERMGIAELKDKLPSKISGGQKQRCAIARALVTNAKVLLADEPTGSLDKNTGKEIMDCFERINKNGTTVILITHDINVAKRCGRIIHIEDGKVV